MSLICECPLISRTSVYWFLELYGLSLPKQVTIMDSKMVSFNLAIPFIFISQHSSVKISFSLEIDIFIF